jgi:hypothetical protein
MIALPMPQFANVAVGSLFTIPSRPGFVFLKISRLMYAGDFDLLRAFTGKLGGRDIYCPSPDLRIDLLGHVRDETLVCALYDAQTLDRIDKLTIERAYRQNPRVEPSGLYETEKGENDK